MSESILERLRYYARVDPRNTVSVFPGDVIEAVDELLRGLSIGRILDMMKAAPCMEEETLKMIRREVADYMYSEGCSYCQDIEASPPPEMLSFNQKKGVCHESAAKKRHNRMGSGRIK